MTAPQDLDADPVADIAATYGGVEPVEPPLPRWEPDNQMVAAVLSSPKAWRGMTQLCDWDRAWLVAGLTLAGMTAKDTAERLDCSLRLVRSIRAEDRTQACVAAQQDNHLLADDLRSERCEHGLTRRELADALREVARLQRQRDEMLSQLQAKGKIETLPCGHPRFDWNVYRYVDRSGSKPRPRVCCRECGSKRATEYRARCKGTDQDVRHTGGVTVLPV